MCALCQGSEELTEPLTALLLGCLPLPPCPHPFLSLNLGGFRDQHEPDLTFYSNKLFPGIRLLLANLNVLSKRFWTLLSEWLSFQPRVLDLSPGHRTHTPEHQRRLRTSRCPRKGVSGGLAAGGSRGCPLGAGAWLSRVALILRLQGRDFELVSCYHDSAPLLPGPAGPGAVADADPAVPVRQLPAAPAGKQLCVHPHPAGRPLGHKDTVSCSLGVFPTCPLPSAGLVSRPRSSPVLVPVLETRAVPPAPSPCPNCIAAAVLRQCQEGSQTGTITLSSLHGVLGNLGPRLAHPP